MPSEAPWRNARHYAGQSAGERAAERRARLLAATQELIGTAGYPPTTVEQICSTAGVSTRHFYQQYTGKEAAFVDLYDHLTNRSFHYALTSLQETAGQPLRRRAPAALLAYLRPMLDDLRFARIAFVEVMGVSQRVEEKRLEYREALIALIETEGRAAVAAGEIAGRDFRFAALALVGAANAIVYDWTARAGRQSVERFEEQLTALAVGLLAD